MNLTMFAMIRNNRSDPKICIKSFKNKAIGMSRTTSGGIGYYTVRKYAS
ncbi:MAG: hypothetical protein IPH84_17160 [Bacteroidales bacterium]|nr:hypothetical protein [Bacteroidales bacterium]